MLKKIQRIKNLVLLLNQYRDEYYNLNKPTVPDSNYDELFDELQLLEIETGYVLSNSPTKTVGYDVISKLQKRTHLSPLKSLNKTKSIEDLNKWSKGKDVLLMLKADGLTVEINYEGGEFVGGYTRGNGEIGEDISHNCKVFKNLPLNIPFKGKLRIVGEAIIHIDDFDELNSKLIEEEKYATPRNLCSGSVRQLNSEICSKRNVYFYAFGILECSEALSDSKFENLGWLDSIGIDTVENTMFLKGDIEEINIEVMCSIAEELNIPIDGLVVSFDSISYSNSLPETSHHPNHSLAYKLEDETEETILRSVEWNTTRSGQVNPTAIFDTVILDNTEVSRASLFNLTFIKEMGLNLLNRIKVSKRNMIIPYIEENLDKQIGNYIPIPNECPSCGEQTFVENTGTADFLFCKNKQCPAQLLDKFSHFVSRDAMNIDGFSDASLEKFINARFLKTFDNIYNLEQYKNQIVNMEGFGIKSYNNIINNIEKSKKVKCSNFIYALGIPGIGKNGARILAKAFNDDWFAFEKALCEGCDFTTLKDFGDITNDNLHSWYNDLEERKLWEKLTYILEFVKEEKKGEISNMDNLFAGCKVYGTGTFANYKKQELKELLESLGAEFASGYAKSLDYLIEGSLKSSSKVDRAIADGIPVLKEEEFLKMIGR